MKKVLLSILALAGAISISAQTLTEVYVPQYFSGRTAANAGNARVPVMALIQLTGLTPSTSYDIKTGLVLTTEANTAFGAGSYWGGTSFGTVTWANAFTTDASGNSGPVWIYIQPTGNNTGGRFLPGSTHSLRYGIVPNGTSMPSSPNFIGTKILTALDLGTTALTAATTDDGAYIVGTADASASGKYVLAYNNTAGTGDPVAIYRVRTHAINQGNNSELPTSVNDIYMGTTNTAGAYALLIPIGANNTNGIRRLETRNADGSLFASSTDADGIWPSGANTTTVARRAFETITATDAPLPVQFKSFTATKANDGVAVKWATASELNNKGFEVQRSINGAKFATISFVKGAGNSNTINNYSFVDADKNIGNVCYRIKQVDFDGKAEFTKTACVIVEAAKEIKTMLVTPNPFKGNLDVVYRSNVSGQATIQLVDMLGKVHLQTQEFVSLGENAIHLNTEALPEGIYFIRFDNGTSVETMRLVKR